MRPSGRADGNEPAAGEPGGIQPQVKVAFVSFGSVEGGAVGLKSNQHALVAAGTTNTRYYMSPGAAHEWHICRRSLREFARVLFKNRYATPSGDSNPETEPRKGLRTLLIGDSLHTTHNTMKTPGAEQRS